MPTNKILFQWDQTAGTRDSLFLAPLQRTRQATLNRCTLNRLGAHQRQTAHGSARMISIKVALQVASARMSSRTKLDPYIGISSLNKKKHFASCQNIRLSLQTCPICTQLGTSAGGLLKCKKELLLSALISLAYLHNYSFLNVHIFKHVIRLAVS